MPLIIHKNRINKKNKVPLIIHKNRSPPPPPRKTMTGVSKQEEIDAYDLCKSFELQDECSHMNTYSFFALCPNGINIGKVKMLRWFLFFKPLRHGSDKLPPTHGAWIEHVRHGHIQCNIWLQDKVVNPTYMYLDPLTLGW